MKSDIDSLFQIMVDYRFICLYSIFMVLYMVEWRW